MNQEDIATQIQRLQVYRRTLAHYLEQQAKLGIAHVAPNIVHGIHEARQNIHHIKLTLRSWGIPVMDHPDDADLSFPNSSQIEASVTPTSDSNNIIVRSDLDGETIPSPHQLQYILPQIGADQKQFIHRISQATRITVVGATNRNLVGYLTEALKIKRMIEGDDAFWQEVKIIFLSERMLQFMDDELAEELPERSKAISLRIRIAGQSKRAIAYFLIRSNRPSFWHLYEYDAMLPFIGAMFEMPNGEIIVQVATLRPGFRTSNHLFLEFRGSSREIAYYQAAFEALNRRSTSQDEIVLVGKPISQANPGFVCYHSRFRRSVLMPNVNSSDWIAAVGILLWQKENERVWPLLQIRTSENSTRELDMLSSISGYINLHDCTESGDDLSTEFILPQSAYENAILRELREELGIDADFPKPELVSEIRFHYPDRDNLYFFLCRVKFIFPLYQIQESAQLQQWSFQDLLQLREYQVLSKVNDVLDKEISRRGQLSTAISVILDNLVLHRQSELAQIITEALQSKKQGSLRKTQRSVSEMLRDRQITYDFKGQRRVLQGLAGLHYREFFFSILFALIDIGVEGAKEYYDWINADTFANAAYNRLKEYYASQKLIMEAGIDV
jgi:8-oxo-dGTP pyrophosphatase MutT (NUDIX family)